MQRRMTSVVLVDDFPLFRKAMADVLGASGEFNVIGQTGDAKVALGLVSLRPDVVIIDVEAKSFDPLTLLRETKFRHKDCIVIMVASSVATSLNVVRAIRMDANGYLLRTIDVGEFLDQLRAVANGGVAASDKLTSALAEHLRSADGSEFDDEPRGTKTLTRREFDVLTCIASGLSNQEVAKHLNIREGTVKVHVKHMLKKLHFRSRVEAALWASEHGYRIGQEYSVLGKIAVPNDDRF